MAAPELPDFITRSGDLAFGPPYDLQNASLYGFMLRAEYGALERLCDRYLNPLLATEGLRYLPALGLIGLVFAHIDAGRTLDPADESKGYLVEREAAFWVPLLRCRGKAGRPAVEEVVWFVPYIWVDSGPAMAGGREVYGFPKQWAQLAVARKAGDPARFSVATGVIPRFERDAVCKLLPLLHAWRADAGVLGDLHGIFLGIEEAAEAVLASVGADLFEAGEHLPVPTWALLRGLLADLEKGIVRFVFLKEFRAIGREGKACYQAIAEAPARVTRFQSGGWLGGEWRLRIHEYDSHPIVADLGLEAAELATALPFWIEYSFRMELGKPIVERTGSG